jgi:hypothetical protein
MLLIVTLTAALVAEASAAVFYVAPKGKDTSPGTKEQPLATLEAARDAARKASDSPHRIVVMPGEYFLTKPLELDARDNGLTIEAEQPGKATLYGGKLVTGWRRDGDRFWCADLPGVKEGTWDFRALIINGRMPQRARFPETETFLNQGTWSLPLLSAVAGHWERKPTHEELTTMPYDPKDIPATLDVKNAEVRMYHMWSESLVGVAQNDTQHHALIFSTESVWPVGALGLKRYIIWNTREGMTQPGLWYLDRTAGRVVYWPLPGEDMTTSRVIAPTAQRIISITGSAKKKVEKIALRGLVLQATTAPLKSAGFGGSALDGAINITAARQCNFENLDICNVGAQGLRARDLADCRIVDCHIHHAGACCITINATDTLISRNHIHHAGVYYPSAAASYLFGQHLHIYRNEIHDAPYSGLISGGGGKGNLIEENLIYRVMREMHDGAAIYGNMKSCVIRGNVVRDVVEFGKGFGASAYYLDEGACDCIVERNVAIGVPMPTHNHITRNIIVRDNVFIVDKDMTISFPKSAGCTFERNTLYVPGKIKLSQPNAIKVWKDNIIYRNGQTEKGDPQAFTIDEAMPPVPTPARKPHSLEAARIDKAPAIDADVALEEWPRKFFSLDRDQSRQAACGAPVMTRFAYDDQCLYVAATVNMFAPAKISESSTWGTDDGVEIAIAGTTPDGKPTTFVLRAYANGKVQSVADAGAPADAAARLGKEIRFAAKTLTARNGKPRGWQGEWAIPLAAIGLKPSPNQKVPFNMAAFYSEFGEWHCWEGTLAENWRLDEAGAILFKGK